MLKKSEIKINANTVLKSSTKHPIFTLIGIGIITLCCGIVTFAIMNPTLFITLFSLIITGKSLVQNKPK